MEPFVLINFCGCHSVSVRATNKLAPMNKEREFRGLHKCWLSLFLRPVGGGGLQGIGRKIYGFGGAI
jgi:hypothetical protein